MKPFDAYVTMSRLCEELLDMGALPSDKAAAYSAKLAEIWSQLTREERDALSRMSPHPLVDEYVTLRSELRELRRRTTVVRTRMDQLWFRFSGKELRELERRDGRKLTYSEDD
jgi:hypothetical protein